MNSLDQQLSIVQDIIQQQLKLTQSDYQAALLALINAKGKMLRSRFLLIMNQLGPKPNDELAEKTAAAIELLHLATLIHDDVLDNSAVRRGVPTLNTQFPLKDAIYLGDYLFTCYFNLITEVSPDFLNLTYNVRGMRAILTGELEQDHAQFQFDRTIDDYIESVKGKTAALFEIACGQGLMISRADFAQIKIGERIGQLFGIAFQIKDDILDFIPQIDTGKPKLNDVKSGVYTLPLIYALNGPKQTELADLLQQEPLPLKQITQLVDQSEGLQAAQKAVNGYLTEVDDLIHQLPDKPARKQLEKILLKVK